MIERFRNYLLVDHRTRWRYDLSCALASLIFYTISVSVGLPGEKAFKLSTLFLFFGVFSTTLWYCYAPTRKTTSEALLPRRALFVQLAKALAAVSVAGFMFARFANTPSAMAAVADASLRVWARGKPTEAKIKAAARIVKEAKANNYPISPNLVTEIGQKIINSSAIPSLQKPAIEAANEFVTYLSSRQALPLNVDHIVPLTVTPTEPRGPTFHVNVGCELGAYKEGAEAHLYGIFSFAGPRMTDCVDLVLWPVDKVVVPLDNVDGKNATLVNCALTYSGGNLKLENVRFANCVFQISAAHARDKNVLQFLRAAMTGEPISLDLKWTSREV